MNWLVVLATAIVATAPVADLRGFLDGQQLHEHCRPHPADDMADLRSALCLGYIVGSADQILAAEAETPPQLKSFCPLRTVIAEDLRGAAMDFLDRHPKARSAAAATLVAAALTARYPCAVAELNDR
ncbi:Rap1a/Tai family immunity protein [Phenylobacterium sp.]|uniref:Rap1a/Tai family immunity protein n=1 Tax=Phenylobacterium sp. TaxID=1871053 RepID=UPI0027371CA9|nr:Rap1a/Tai family immunity protein [Phenylobacterium sp.]MDP3852418.1 Rap1a/Tai family immunity protein [Phenylobacterium sp.]